MGRAKDRGPPNESSSNRPFWHEIHLLISHELCVLCVAKGIEPQSSCINRMTGPSAFAKFWAQISTSLQRCGFWDSLWRQRCSQCSRDVSMVFLLVLRGPGPPHGKHHEHHLGFRKDVVPAWSAEGLLCSWCWAPASASLASLSLFFWRFQCREHKAPKS